MCPISSFNMSSRLFSKPFYDTQQNFAQRGAVSVMNESDIHLPMIFPEMILPDYSLFQNQDVDSSVSRVSKVIVKTTNQKCLAL